MRVITRSVKISIGSGPRIHVEEEEYTRVQTIALIDKALSSIRNLKVLTLDEIYQF